MTKIARAVTVRAIQEDLASLEVFFIFVRIFPKDTKIIPHFFALSYKKQYLWTAKTETYGISIKGDPFGHQRILQSI